MDLEQQLHAALAPCRPGPALRARVISHLTGAQPVPARRGAPGRLVLLGMVLAMAAAALMLATSLGRPPAPIAAMTPVRAVAREPGEAVVSAPTPAVKPPVMQPAPRPAEPKPAVLPVKPFTVSVLPLENTSPEAPVRAAVDTFYRELLDGLSATPGLVLTMPASQEAAESIAADYRLTVKGTGSTQANKFTITLRAARVGRVVQPYQLSGVIDCRGTADCGDARGMAVLQLKLLQESMFPETPARAQQMLARLQDPVLGARERLEALFALESLRGDGVVPPGGRSKEGLAALRDPVVIRAAVELAAAATDEFVRAQVWKKMRGVGDAQLLQPLIAAARIDASSNARAEAVMTLAADFADNPDVRDALEAIARQDSRAVVRVLARSGLSGRDAWPSQVAASLKDPSLSDLERMEAIYYAMNQSQARSSDLRDVLTDDESIRAFVQVLPRAVRTVAAEDKARAGELVTVLVSRLVSVDHPAVTGMLLDAYENPGWADQFLVLNQLARRAADPAVRTLLEKVAGETADTPLREIARNALGKPAADAQSPTR